MKAIGEVPRLGKEEVARRKAKAGELISQDRQKLLMKMPFIGGMLMRLDIVPVYDERLATAATDGDRIYFDIIFYSQLDKDERLFVLAHEAWHCALLHFMRRQNRDAERFNIATDLEIHFILTDENLKAPFVLPHDPKWKGLSAEEIYERYPQFVKENPNMWGRSSKTFAHESEHIKKGRDGGSFDSHPIKEDEQTTGDAADGTGTVPGREGIGYDPDFNPIVKVGAEERCRERLTAAVQHAERVAGGLPEGITRLVKNILTPEICWKELLAQFVTTCYGGSRRWLPPARRHVWEGLYLQSQRQERLKAVVAIDTSGSTYFQDVDKFLTELTSLLNSFGGYDLTVIQCEVDIQKIERFDDANRIGPDHKWEVCGGGGGDLRPPFRYIEDHPELAPDLMIYFTDGYEEAPDRAPNYPVMWLLPSDGCKPADWGTVVWFKE